MKYTLVKTSLIALCISLTSCYSNNDKEVTGSGKALNQERDVSGFDQIALRGIGTVTIQQGDTDGLTVKADDNLINHLKTTVSGGALIIDMSFDSSSKVSPVTPVEYLVTVKDLKMIDIEGTGKVVNKGTLQVDDLKIYIAGTGMGDLNVEAKELDIRIPGLGELTIKGTTNSQKVQIEGKGSYQALDLVSKEADVTLDGGGVISIYVTDELDVDIKGQGVVSYKGDPKIKQEISGTGVLRKTRQ